MILKFLLTVAYVLEIFNLLYFIIFIAKLLLSTGA